MIDGIPETWEEAGIVLPRASGGGHVKTKCPQCQPPHNPYDRPLYVSLDLGVWKCMHCEWRGHLTWARQNDDWKAALSAKREYKLPPMPEAEDRQLSERAMKWLAGRGIDPDLAMERGLYTGHHFVDERDGRERNYGDLTITFPYMSEDGEVVHLKHRSITDKRFWSSAGTELILWNVQNVDRDALDGIVVTEGECVYVNTEIMTEEGWVMMRDYRGQRVLAVGQNGEPSRFERPSRVVINPARKHEYLIESYNRRGMTIKTTPRHQMIGIDKSGRWRKFDAQDKPSSISDRLPRSTTVEGNGLPLTDDQLAFSIAYSADGYVAGSRVAFRFKKQRKVDRLNGIMDRLEMHTTTTTYADGVTCVRVDTPEWLPGKLLPMAWATESTRAQREFILSELTHWDGNTVPNRTQTEYATAIKHNADVVQAIAHLSDRVSTIIPRSNAFGSWYKVSILHGKQHGSWQSVEQRVIPNTDKTYCVTVSTGAIMVRTNGHVMITGNCDVLAMEQAGVPNAVSVPNGAPNPFDKNGRPVKIEYKMEYLNAHEDLIKSVKQVIIATDMDDPGRALAKEMARRIGPEKCSIVEWPDGCKDANEVLLKLGPRAVAAAVADARPVPVEGLYTGFDIEAGLIDLYENGADRGVGFGFPIFDQFYRVKTGYMTVVTGIPGMGKSTVLDALLVLLSQREGWTHTMFSPEQQPIEWHHTQLIEQRVGMPFWDGQNERMSKETMLDASIWVSKHFSYLLPPRPTIDAILELADLEVYRKGIRGIVIDPWNEIEHSRPPGISETEYISGVLSRFRNWLRNREVHGWMVAHPTKQYKVDGKYEVPDLYSISGGANWYNKADFGLVIHREKGQKSDEVDIHILKSRRRELATVGQVRFRYSATNKRIIELPRDQQPIFNEED